MFPSTRGARSLRALYAAFPTLDASFIRAGIAIASLGVATALALAFRSMGITESSIVLLYLLSVVVASVTAGRVYGIGASVVAVVLFNFLFTEPRFTFVVNDAQYLVTFPVMLVVAVITSELTARIRRQAQEAERREVLTKLLYESSRSLLGAQGQAEVVRSATRHLSNLIERPVACAVDAGEGDPLVLGDISPTDREALLDPVRRVLGAHDGVRPSPVTTPGAVWTLVPVGVQGRTLAVIAVDTGGEAMPTATAESLRAVVVQLALALDREEMSRREEHARLEIERERLRANLLQSISHDLRSPLTAIVGSATTLLAEEAVSDETRSELARSIRDDAKWLTSLVENLLSLTRAEESVVRFQGVVEVLDDVLGSALGRVDRIHETHRLRVDLGDEPVLVRMDSGLIEQLFINLLENALQHTPAGTTVCVRVRRDEGWVVIVVEDDGPGLSEHVLEHAFERFYTERAIPDARRGMGLGLSICRAITAAHGGTITVRNLVSGGAIFEVRLPAEADAGPVEPMERPE